MRIGGAYTRTNWSQATSAAVAGLDSPSEYATVGTRMDWDVFQFGLVYSSQTNGDAVAVPLGDLVTPVAFDADGVEAYARLSVKRFALIGGFTYQNPGVRSSLVDPDLNTRYAIVGGEWFVARTAKTYGESKIDLDSVSPICDAVGSVFTIGFRYDFSWRISHK